MLDAFSLRSRQIVFAARFEAGERGAKIIDIDDLLVGLVLEDQGMLEKYLSSLLGESGHLANQDARRNSFFSPEIANNFLAQMGGILPRAHSIDLSAEMPLSAALEHTFNSAKDIQTRFQHSEIEPLHILAALLTEESSQGVKLLQSSGITQEKVLLKLGGANEN